MSTVMKPIFFYSIYFYRIKLVVYDLHFYSTKKTVIKGVHLRSTANILVLGEGLNLGQVGSQVIVSRYRGHLLKPGRVGKFAYRNSKS